MDTNFILRKSLKFSIKKFIKNFSNDRMINIKVIEAKNIPIINGHPRKTKISCFSYSSYRFYYGSYKSKDKTTNPKWNSEFSVDLFKIIHLRFSFFGLRNNKKIII